MVAHAILSSSPPRRPTPVNGGGASSPSPSAQNHYCRDTREHEYHESAQKHHQQNPHTAAPSTPPPSSPSSPSPPPQNKSLFIIMEQLMSFLNLTVQTSSKFLSPALTNLAQTLFPTIVQFLQQLTPLRIQHWIHILYISYANIIHLVLHSNQGQILTSHAVALFENYMNLLTSVNMRQVIIDSMSLIIKCMSVLQSSEMKDVISSMPVLTIRMMDTLSSGEAKLFYHSFSSLCSSMIEFFNQEDATVLIAEVTARIVHALEMEHCNFSPALKNRKKRKILVAGGRRMMRRRNKTKRKNTIPSYGGGGGGVAAQQSKQRRERNQCMNQTYNKRMFLRDNVKNQYNFDTDNDDETNNIHPTAYNQDREVEDAILSSLSPDQTSYTDNAWLTRLGRSRDAASNNIHRKKDGASGDNNTDVEVSSLPSKVVLKNDNQNVNEIEDDENAQFSIDSSINIEDLDIRSSNLNASEEDDEHDDLTDVVDTTYLRSGIEKRKNKQNLEKLKYAKRNKQDSIDLSRRSFSNDGSIKDSRSNECQPQLDIEDLVLVDNNQASNEKVQSDKGMGGKKKKMSIKPQEYWSTDSMNNEVPTYQDITSNKRAKNFARGEESSIAHFYRTLDDIVTKIRNKKIAEALKQSLVNTEHDGKVNKKSDARWYPNAAAAAGAGNEYGQDTLESLSTSGMRKPNRFRANIGISNVQHENQHDMQDKSTFWKDIFQMLMGHLTTKQKFVMGTVLLVYVLFSIVWFTFGCYGIYRWFIASPTATSIPAISSTPTSNEYIIRIVQETNPLPKTVLMDTVTKAIEDQVLSENPNLAEGIAASLAADKEL